MKLEDSYVSLDRDQPAADRRRRVRSITLTALAGLVAACSDGSAIAPSTGGDQPAESESVGSIEEAVVPLRTIRLRVINPVGMPNASTVRQNIATAAANANAHWIPHGVQFTVDATSTADPALGSEAAMPKTANCSTAVLKAAGAKYQGFIPLFSCSSSVRAGGESSWWDNAAYVGSNETALLSHELGHYFGLSHSFVEGRKFDNTFAAVVKGWLNSVPSSQRALIYAANVKTWFRNAGAPDDVPGSLEVGVPPSLQDPPATVQDTCRNPYTGKIVVRLDDGTDFSARFTPDRTNPMSYFGFCNGAVPGQYQFTPKQGNAIQAALADQRLHLVGPGLQWSTWDQVAGATGKPLGSSTFNGRLFLFAAGNGQNQTVYANSAAPKQAFVGWGVVGGATDVALGSASFDNRLYLFTKGLGTDHNIYTNIALPGQAFTGWIGIGGATDRTIAATSFDSRLYLFAKGDGADRRIYFNVALPQQPFVGWSEIGGRTDEALATTVFDNRLYIFAKSEGQNLYNVNVALPQQPFVGWSPIPSTLKSGVTPRGQLAAASFKGRLYVFARGSDSRIYFNTALPQQPFASWVEVPGAMVSDAPPTVSVFDNRLYVAVKKSNNTVFVASAAGT